MCHSVILWVINLFLEFIIRTNLRFVEDILIITNNCHCKNNFSLLLKEYLSTKLFAFGSQRECENVTTKHLRTDLGL